ncbi:MAG: hypothetical protein IT317_05410 [Anaerolineales bacterium]|nr:hypothetical protein [Anaerolineales bacterium]
MPAQELNCANCGAAIDVRTVRGMVAACTYCGTSFVVPETMTPEPTMGNLLLGADFRDPELPGWLVSTPDNLEFRPGSPAELWATFAASDLIHPVIRTPGPLDDFDAGVTIRFISGVHDYVSAGFEVRSWDTGDYVVRISAQGTFNIGWHEKGAWGGDLVPWAAHPALRGNWGDRNRLRVVMRGEQMRVYLNGVVAASLRDGRFPAGRLRVMVGPGKAGAATVAYSDAQIRELLPD